LHGPPNNAPRKQIDDDCEIKEALVGADVGDICDPELVRSVDIELSVQGVVGHDRRAAAIGPIGRFVRRITLRGNNK
jgi:hypothetical protein